MLQHTLKDSKKQNRLVHIDGFVKPSGIVCASVRNDRNDTYFVQMFPGGRSTCEHMVNGKREKCDGHKFTGHCYHVTAVIALATKFHTFDELNTYSVSEAIADADTQVRINEAQAVRDAAVSNPYDVLATTKQVVSHGYGCCGHIVKREHDGMLCGACACK